MKTINMKELMYLNLFEKITKVRTRYSFKYNEKIFFCVPKRFLKQAVGEDAKNIKKINKITGKRIRVIPQPNPNSKQEIKEFIKRIVNPIEFSEIEIEEKDIKITAGRMNKAALIGKNKRRLNEMNTITKDYFGKEFKVV